MATRLADRVTAARRRRFIGRAAEQALFNAALAAAELPFNVLCVFAPGGVGKTALLHRFMHLCQQAQIPAAYIDARNIEPSPEAFDMALRLALGDASFPSAIEALLARPGRQVILIDTYETLTSLTGWLREVFLPQLPDSVLVVLAGRNPPPTTWRVDPGWRTLVRYVPLRNLTPQESREYLTRRNIPADQHQAVLEFTHSHPLALSLVADLFDQDPDLHFQPESALDVIKTLLEQFLQHTPSPTHRTALEACALTRVTTEALLAQMLAMPAPLVEVSAVEEGDSAPHTRQLFEWLQGLSFIESGPDGLFPHDLARDALATELRWRNPDWYAELHRRARAYYMERLPEAGGQGNLFDLIFLHRSSPMVRPFFEWQASGRFLPDRLREEDTPALVALAAEHEGADSARLAEHWLQRQPDSVLLFRNRQGQTVGFLAMIALEQADPADLQADPAAQAAWAYLQRRAPLRAGERATHFRFWMVQETYQQVSPVQSLIFVGMVGHYLITPGLAFTFIPCADPDFWTPLFAYAEMARVSEADFVVGGRRYGVYGHDWRAMPPAMWLEVLARREIAQTPAAVSPLPARQLLVLSQEVFAQAVSEALKNLSRPDVLRGNPLLRSRLVVERAETRGGDAGRVAALQAVLREAAAMLQETPRDVKFHRALYHTYFQPAPTQERAAELLDLPFSTFRRHLKSGVDRVTEIMWQREIGGLEK